MFYVKVDLPLFLAMLFSCLWIQIATNLFNEYYDFKRGLDTAESVGIGGAIVRHGMKPKTILQLALASYGIAILLGVYICASSVVACADRPCRHGDRLPVYRRAAPDCVHAVR